jgi:uncharacterized membrane protein (DUF485 family)
MASYRRQRYNSQKSLNGRFLFVLGIAFFLIYVSLGYILIFTDYFPLNISANGRLMFGILLMVYGVFRFIRLWQSRNDR